MVGGKKRSNFGACVLVLLMLVASSGHAEDSLNPQSLLIADDTVTIEVVTSIENTLVIDIQGHRNGGYGANWPVDPIFRDASAPGLLSQVGVGHSLDMVVLGDANLFSVAQVGQNNTVTGLIQGTQNAVAINQIGSQNVAAFSQVGTRNSLAITQTSW